MEKRIWQFHWHWNWLMDEIKINDAKRRIESCIERNKGFIEIAFSGGKDSCIVLHLCRKFFPHIKRTLKISSELFYPEVAQIIQETIEEEENLGNKIIITKNTDLSLIDIINTYGVFCFDKQVSETFKVLIVNSFKSQKTKERRIEWLKSIKNGRYTKMVDDILNNKFHYKWAGAKCCKLIKLSKKKNKNFVLTGLRKDESPNRKNNLKCVNDKLKTINPINDWSTNECFEYIKEENIKIASCYQWVKRTGCICCPYSLQSYKTYLFKKSKYPLIFKELEEKTDLIKFLKEYVWFPNSDYENEEKQDFHNIFNQ